jgi:hypothetical protein
VVAHRRERRVRVAGLDRTEDGPVFAVRGLGLVLLGEPALDPEAQQRPGALQEVLEHDIVGADGDLQVEPDVGLEERVEVLERVGHHLDVTAQLLDVGVGGPLGGVGGRLDLEPAPHLDELARACRVQHETPAEGGRQQLRGLVAQVGARARTHRDDAEDLEGGQGLADGRPPDAETFGELPLGREARPGGVGVPYEAARAMLYGHTWIALTNGLRGSNPFSDACHIAMDYGRESIVRDDWKKIFDDSQLDSVIARMLKIDAVRR